MREVLEKSSHLKRQSDFSLWKEMHSIFKENKANELGERTFEIQYSVLKYDFEFPGTKHTGANLIEISEFCGINEKRRFEN